MGFETPPSNWYHIAMDNSPTDIPWNRPSLWCEANTTLARTIHCHHTDMAAAIQTAGKIRMRLESIFPCMDALCRHTCPTCTDNCCQRAWVWADFKDLLFYHLAGITPPEAQLLGGRGEHCRYAGPFGCRLDRFQRPFVCSWYLCPAQTLILQNTPADRDDLVTSLQWVQAARRRLEAQFIQAVFNPGEAASYDAVKG
ncbi:conserved hypothetical protein [Desulfosarcina cetonica]|uniref:hypothetical protein n=1 Tax=Desulfosarcina cetonica TaxID=90730 RepID=UPI0006D04BAA|nr:hypothetical protein [Desulfosarcina cetonica]VTR69595.1 conserved hypothetical protein [Desulfosarcina cetonica]